MSGPEKRKPRDAVGEHLPPGVTDVTWLVDRCLLPRGGRNRGVIGALRARWQPTKRAPTRGSAPRPGVDRGLSYTNRGRCDQRGDPRLPARDAIRTNGHASREILVNDRTADARYAQTGKGSRLHARLPCAVERALGWMTDAAHGDLAGVTAAAHVCHEHLGTDNDQDALDRGNLTSQLQWFEGNLNKRSVSGGSLMNHSQEFFPDGLPIRIRPHAPKLVPQHILHSAASKDHVRCHYWPRCERRSSRRCALASSRLYSSSSGSS